MQLNEKNSAIHFLDGTAYPDFEVPRALLSCCDDAICFMHKQFPEKKQHFKNNIQYICHSLYKAYLDIEPHTKWVLSTETNGLTGTLVVPRPNDGTSTIFYDIQVTVKEGRPRIDGDLIFFMHGPKYQKPVLSFYVGIKNDIVDSRLGLDFVKANVMVAFFFGLLACSKGSLVEGLHVRAGKQSYVDGGFIVNQTRFPLQLLHDPHNFNNLVKESGARPC